MRTEMMTAAFLSRSGIMEMAFLLSWLAKMVGSLRDVIILTMPVKEEGGLRGCKPRDKHGRTPSPFPPWGSRGLWQAPTALLSS